MNFFKYVYCRAYYFCYGILKEREFAWAWAVMPPMSIFFFTIITVSLAIQISQHSLASGEMIPHQGLFALLGLAILTFYVKRGDKYKAFLEWDRKLSPRQKRSFLYLTVVYCVILFVAYYWAAETTREFNLRGK